MSKNTVHPSHGVYFYDNDWFLVQKLRDFVREGVAQKEVVIMIATEPHRKLVRQVLSVEEIAYCLEWDASELLSTFFANGSFKRDRFLDVTHDLFTRARQFERPIRIYGEMVMLLWRQGLRNRALELEHLWNDLAPRSQCSLLCGYPVSRERCEELFEVFAAHSHLCVGPPGYLAT
jgi:hypothetical protein